MVEGDESSWLRVANKLVVLAGYFKNKVWLILLALSACHSICWKKVSLFNSNLGLNSIFLSNSLLYNSIHCDTQKQSQENKIKM